MAIKMISLVLIFKFWLVTNELTVYQLGIVFAAKSEDQEGDQEGQSRLGLRLGRKIIFCAKIPLEWNVHFPVPWQPPSATFSVDDVY